MANQQGYSSSEILAMQKDAIRRVNEMQRIAREKIALTQPNLNNPIVKEKTINKERKTEPIPLTSNNLDHCETEVIKTTTFSGMLDKLNLDDEKILLILLMLILLNEGADMMLILALGYILL